MAVLEYSLNTILHMESHSIFIVMVEAFARPLASSVTLTVAYDARGLEKASTLTINLKRFHETFAFVVKADPR